MTCLDCGIELSELVEARDFCRECGAQRPASSPLLPLRRTAEDRAKYLPWNHPERRRMRAAGAATEAAPGSGPLEARLPNAPGCQPGARVIQ